MARKRILFVGPAQIRFAVGTPSVPDAESTVLSSANYSFSPGGRSALCAIAAARLGFDAALCARVGDDYYGDRLREVFRMEGVHATNVTVDRERQTGLSLELAEPNGTSRSILFPGANSSLDAACIETALSCYPDALVVSLDADRDAVLAANRYAADKKLPFFLDATPSYGQRSVGFPFEQLNGTEILLLEENDAFAFTGIRPVNEEQRKLACYTLKKMLNVKYILLRLGSRGCFLYDGKYFSAMFTFDEQVTDAAGANEAFTAALIGHYISSGDLHAASEFANGVFAACASKPGEYQSLPRKGEYNKA